MKKIIALIVIVLFWSSSVMAGVSGGAGGGGWTDNGTTTTTNRTVAIGATGRISEETNTLTFDDGDGLPITLQDIRTATSGGDAAAIHDNTGGEIAAITGKATPVDADVLLIEDSAAANAKKSLTWANLKATNKTYFDTLYLPLVGGTLTGGLAIEHSDGLKVGKASTTTGTAYFYGNAKAFPFGLWSAGADAPAIGWKLPSVMASASNTLINVDADGTVDYGPKTGTFTDGKWCTYTTADGLKCTENPPAGTDEIVYQSDCSSITNGLCIDSDDNKIYYYNGSAVALVAPLASVTLNDGEVAGKLSGTLQGIPIDDTPEDSSAKVASSKAVYDGLATKAATSHTHTFTESFVVKSPVDADDFLLMKAPAALTITALNCVAQGSTPSISVEVQECDGDGANCAGGGISLTADGSNDADTSFTDAAIDSGDWLKVILGAPTGTVNFLSCTLSYTR